MSDTVIKVENLSKEYRLGVVGHDTLYRDLQSWWAKVRGKEDPNSLLGAHPSPQTPLPATRRKGLASHGGAAATTFPSGDAPLSKAGEREDNELKKHFLALNDVSFEVKQGDVLGIIGRNGAGKSTLLKILSRITSPSAGEIKIKGRLASLLEVGTGFHHELTGRENVYMNGAILGMRRHEIAKKMDEIIAFSGVEKFIDTPVKRYSSGMMVRLAFSVASNLDAEILVIDEVLAVGDAEFQKKCLGKMDDVAKKQGRTVLFVSHQMNAVENLCTRGIVLNKGQHQLESSDIRSIIKYYLNNGSNHGSNIVEWNNCHEKKYSIYFTPIRFWFSDKNDAILNLPVRNDDDFYINLIFNVEEESSDLEIAFRIYDKETNMLIFVTQHTDTLKSNWPKILLGENVFKIKFPKHFLNEGSYRIELSASLYRKAWIIEPGKENINLDLDIKGGLSESPYWHFYRGGVVAPVLEWEKL